MEDDGCGLDESIEGFFNHMPDSRGSIIFTRFGKSAVLIEMDLEPAAYVTSHHVTKTEEGRFGLNIGPTLYEGDPLYTKTQVKMALERVYKAGQADTRPMELKQSYKWPMVFMFLVACLTILAVGAMAFKAGV